MKPQSLIPVNVILFGKMVFTDDQIKIPHPICLCHYKKNKIGHGYIHRAMACKEEGRNGREASTS
jgi:hypothetical protein